MTTGPVEPNADTVYVYRSTDGGVTWTLLAPPIASVDGFALTAHGRQDTNQFLTAPPNDVVDAALLGIAGWDGSASRQQNVWMSGDAGTSRLANPNWTDPFFDNGAGPEYQIFTPGGIISFPGTRPVVVGGQPSTQPSIVG